MSPGGTRVVGPTRLFFCRQDDESAPRVAENFDRRDPARGPLPSNEGGQHRVGAVFVVFCPLGTEQTPDCFVRVNFRSLQLQPGAEETLQSREFAASFGHRSAFVFDRAGQTEPPDGGRVRIDLDHRPPCRRPIGRDGKSFPSQRGNDAQRTRAKRAVGRMRPRLFAMKHAVGQPVDRTRSCFVRADHRRIEAEQHRLVWRQMEAQPLPQFRITAGQADRDIRDASRASAQKTDSIRSPFAPREIEAGHRPAARCPAQSPRGAAGGSPAKVVVGTDGGAACVTAGGAGCAGKSLGKRAASGSRKMSTRAPVPTRL